MIKPTPKEDEADFDFSVVKEIFGTDIKSED